MAATLRGSLYVLGLLALALIAGSGAGIVITTIGGKP
jgi:hypothetical protein